MMKLIKFELYKIFKQKSIYAVLIVLIGLISLTMFANGPSVENAYQYYKSWEGPILEKDVHAAKEKLEAVNEEQSTWKGREFTTKEQATSLTKEAVYNQVIYAEDRQHRQEQTIKELDNKINQLQERSMEGYQYRKLVMEKNMVEDIDLNSLYYSRPVAEMVDFVNTFALVLLGALILIGIAPVFTQEYTSGVDQYILSSKNGRKKLVTAKLFASGIFVLIIVAFSVFYNVISRISVYGNHGWKAALQSAAKYTTSPYDFNLLNYFLTQIGFQILAGLAFAFLVLFISSVSRNALISFFVSGFIFGFPILIVDFFGLELSWLTPILDFSYTNIMKVEGLFLQFNTVNLFGYPVLNPIFAVLVLVVLSAITLPLLYRVITKKQIV